MPSGSPALDLRTSQGGRVGENRPVSVDEVIDELYGLPLEEFTRARDEAERDLRMAGEREQAAQVKALRKPTAAAAAVNRLVRSNRAEVEAFLETAARLRDAQVAGKGDLAAANRAEREALEKLVVLGGEPVRRTLQAAAVDDDAAGELLQARLVRELEPAGFGTLLAYATPAAAKTAPPSPPDDGAARALLQEAREKLAAATEDERQARRRLTQAQRELERAQTAVEKAERELDRLRRD